MESEFDDKQNRIRRLESELEEFKFTRQQVENDLRRKLEETFKETSAVKHSNEPYWKLFKEKNNYESQLRSHLLKELTIQHQMSQPEFIDEDKLMGFELSNLIRD